MIIFLTSAQEHQASNAGTNSIHQYHDLLNEFNYETCIHSIRRSENMNTLINLYNRAKISELWITRPEFLKYIPFLRTYFTNARIVYLSHDLHYLRFFRQFQIELNTRALLKSVYYYYKERSAFQTVDAVITFSPAERSKILSMADRALVTAIPLQFYKPADLEKRATAFFRERPTIYFIGSPNHQPNVDAAQILVTRIMPQIWRTNPDCKLTLIGVGANGSLNPTETRVSQLGQLIDLKTFLRTPLVLCAPLRFGAGVKGKLIEAWANSIPVITTPIGIEGTYARPGLEVECGSTLQEITKRTLHVLEKPSYRVQLTLAGLALVTRHYSKHLALQCILSHLHHNTPNQTFKNRNNMTIPDKPFNPRRRKNSVQ